ncbi:hypothetical protein M0813_03551 [Anaeramoeba flamelloides]|uniref:Uncharacterized protein n=1 Tax=Anaeramoeba flamelloides TaxID=1746091 RepID=A0ABQ8XU08_9EUKA|nr:hypothetical protein M0813_03551 [Anaeramoeba flamelloides]
MDKLEAVGFIGFIVYGFIIAAYFLLKYFRGEEKKKVHLVAGVILGVFWLVVWIMMLISKTAKFSYLAGMLYAIAWLIFSIVLLVREKIPKKWIFVIVNVGVTTLSIIGLVGAY